MTALCEVSKTESIHIVLAMAAKHSLTKAATEDVLKLVKLHLPKDVSYPVSMHNLSKAVSIDRSWYSHVFYCVKCSSELNSSLVCNKCSVSYTQKELKNNGNFFVIYDLRLQFMSILEDVTVKKSLLKVFYEQKMANLYDGVESGSCYRKLQKNATDFTCSFNTDGVPVFKSSKFSIWPVLISINELPFSVRKRNVIIAGLWFGTSKPQMSLFLNSVVSEMNSLYRQGIKWRSLDQISICSRILFVLCPVDSVARCMVQGHTQFNGKFGCNWCKNPGVTIKKGKGHCRIYPDNLNSSLRNGSEYKINALEERFFEGQKCKSPLIELLNFNLVDGFSVDYMHCVFLGIVRSFTKKWMSDSKEEYYIGRQANDIDGKFLKFKVPKEIVRTCRSVTNLRHWKASEWRTWLFVLPVVLKDILSKKYLKHFSFLSRAIFLCSKDKFTVQELAEAHELIQKFLENGQILYGDSFYSYNVHQLNHLIETVKNWGPLWGSSAFQFESVNGKLLKYIKTANGVAMQVSEKFMIDIQMHRILSKFTADTEACSFFKNLNSNSRLARGQFEILKSKLSSDLDTEILELLKCQCNPREIFLSNIGIINYQEFRAKSTTKRINNIVMLGHNYLGVIQNFVKVLCGIETKLFVVVNSFRTKSFKTHPHILYCKKSSNLSLQVVEMCNIVNTKYFVYESDVKWYFIEVPNLFEID